MVHRVTVIAITSGLCILLVDGLPDLVQRSEAAFMFLQCSGLASNIFESFKSSSNELSRVRSTIALADIALVCRLCRVVVRLVLICACYQFCHRSNVKVSTL